MTLIEVVDDFETVELIHPSGKSSAKISTFGATVTSWKIFENEMLFMSKNAITDGSAPIRGGIPIVFPQFGPGPLKQHGFARTSIWEHVKTETDNVNNEIVAIFRLTPNNEIRAIWDYNFELIYEVRLGFTTLVNSFTVVNHDDKNIPFTFLFHNYFNVSNFDGANVTGLQGLQYVDKVKGGAHTDSNSVLMIANEGEIDRIYSRPSAMVGDRTKPHTILSVGDGGNADVVMNTVNLNDVVVWNPGKTKSDALKDMHPDGYKEFVCLETGEVTTPLSLPPGKKYAAGQKMTLRILSSVANKIRQEVATNAYPKMDRIAGLKK